MLLDKNVIEISVNFQVRLINLASGADKVNRIRNQFGNEDMKYVFGISLANNTF